MKYMILVTAMTAAFIFAAFTGSSPALDKGDKTELTHQSSLLRHVVLFKFKETAESSDIKQVEDAFAALPSKIPQITDFEWGMNNSPEGLDKGFTHCFFVTFANEDDRAIYLPHPAHKEFVEILSPHLEDVLVIDYWTKD